METYKEAPAAGKQNGGAFETTQADYSTADQKLCSGYGKYHSPNAKKNPRPLVTVTVADIETMAAAPLSLAKSSAQWFIPSTLLSRTHAEQHKDGEFWALWGDVDKTKGLAFIELVEVARRIIPGNFIAYTSRSATESEQKARLIIQLSEAVSGGEWKALQKILNSKLEAAGIVADDVNEGTGQPCYLPNRGEFYDYYIDADDWESTMNPDSWADELAEEMERQAAEDAKKKAKVKPEKIHEYRASIPEGGVVPSDYIRANYPSARQLLEDSGAVFVSETRFYSPDRDHDGNPGGIYAPDTDRFCTYHHNDPFNDGYWHGQIDLLMRHKGIDWNADGTLMELCRTLEVAGGVTIELHNQRAHMAAKEAEEAAAEFKNETEADPAAALAVDLFDNLTPPPFPVDLLPPAIAGYARDQAELIGVDPAVIALAAIGAAAACIDDRIEIQPKRHDTGWREQARLWVGIIGDPSAKKSPGISKAMAPLFKIDQKWRDETNQANAEWLKACDDTPKGEEEPPAPIGKRLILNDATVEKMGDIMSKSEPRGMLSYQDELSGWLASMDAYKNGAGGKDKAAWLEAYNGGPKAIDRIARGSTFVENWSACVLGGIQPSVVQAYAQSTNHDGMLQRFILVKAGEARLGADRRPDLAARERYNFIMDQMAGTQAAGDTVVTLSEDAHKIREALDEKLHKLTVNHPNKFLAAALGKWNGLFARLLLTFHCIESAAAQEYPVSNEVSGETARRVSDLMWFTLLPHAIAFYQGLDPIEDTARELAALILAHEWARFTVKRDLNRNWKASRKLKPWELEGTLDRLEAFGWIFPEPLNFNEKGKPAAYRVNPGIHARFAEQAERERERRKEVTAMMADLKQ